MTPQSGTYKILKDHIYDTLFLPENMPDHIAYLFIIPLGQYAGRKIKMHDHTNMVLGGCLPAPERFSLREIKCAFYQGGEFIEPFPGKIYVEKRMERVLACDVSGLIDTQCKSLLCQRPHEYPEGFRQIEDDRHPIICTFEQLEYFSVFIELERKPDIPTEFVVVLAGDHYVPVMEMNPAKVWHQ